MVMVCNKNHKREKSHTCADYAVVVFTSNDDRDGIKIAIARTAKNYAPPQPLSSLLLALLFFRERIKIAILLITIL